MPPYIIKKPKKDECMSQDKIDIKDVTPKTFNPKTHKETGIVLTQAIASTFEKVKGLTKNCVATVVGSYCYCLLWYRGSHTASDKRSCLISATSSSTFRHHALSARSDPTRSALCDRRVWPVLHYHLFRPSLVWLSLPANRVDLHVHLV